MASEGAKVRRLSALAATIVSYAPGMIVVSESAANGPLLGWADFAKAALPLGLRHLTPSTLYCFLLALFI